MTSGVIIPARSKRRVWAAVLLAAAIVIQLLVADADLTYCYENLGKILFDDLVAVFLPFVPLVCLLLYVLKLSKTSPFWGLAGILLWGLILVLSILRVFDEARGFTVSELSAYEKWTAGAVAAACVAAAVAFATAREARAPATLIMMPALILFVLGIVRFALSDSYYFLSGYQVFVQYAKFAEYMLVLIAAAVMYWSPERLG